jgi:anti-sigma factor RsiW
MMTNPSNNPDSGDDLLHAFVDGRVTPEQDKAVRARLAADPQAASDVAVWAQQREALRALHGPVLAQAVPAALQQAASRLEQRGNAALRWQRWGGMAAAVLLAFGVGWVGHAQWSAARSAGLSVRAGDFARQAIVAHAVYLPEVRHPVEVGVAQQEHLVQWLSKRLERPLKIPNLAAQGYELVGGRLLPGEDGARAQFMFQNAGGDRVTLYVGAIAPGGPAAKSAQETAFRFASHEGAAGFYWVDQGFGYALAGKLPRAKLLDLAESVHRQL